MSMLEAARAAARAAHEGLYYKGLCTVVEYQDTTDPDTNLTHQEEVTVQTDIPCDLSYENQSAVAQTDTTAALSQGLKVFIAPEITVKAGSKLVITQNGITRAYAMSGEPAVYLDHQEIVLVPFERWA